MRIFVILSALVLMSCGVQKNNPTYGKTTLEELIVMRGEPINEESIPVKDSKILNYSNGEKFQIKNDLVESRYSNPAKNETTLIYWQHTFKECDVVVETLNKNKQGHEKSEIYMRCDPMGVGVVYTEDSDAVLRVVEYEKK